MISTRTDGSPSGELSVSQGGSNGSLNNGSSGWMSLSVAVVGRADDAAPSELNTQQVDDLRRFHLLGTDAESLTSPGRDVLPALLAPFRQVDKVRHDFPLVVIGDADGEETNCISLGDHLSHIVEGLGASASMVADNQGLLEREAARTLEVDGKATSARELLGKAGTAVREQLGLKGEHDARLASQLATVIERVADDAWLIGLNDDTPILMYYRAARDVAQHRRAEFLSEVDGLRSALKGLLHIERSKEPGARDAGAVGGALGSVGRFVDAAALSELMGPHRGSKAMDAERRARIESVLVELDGFVAQDDQPFMTLIRSKGKPARLEGFAGVEEVADPEPLERAAILYDAQADELTALFRAVRIARLEAKDAYRPDRHAAWFDAFRFASFSDDELLLLPPVVVLLTGWELTGTALENLSRLLRSGRSVKVMLETTPASASETEASVLLGTQFRFELGYFGISHREAFVHQSTPARPQHYLQGCVRALSSTRPVLHAAAAAYDLSHETPPLGAWLHSNAAVESRALPLFLYDPAAGRSWARRFDFSENPQPVEDWPVYELKLTEGVGKERTLSLAFTFADFALLELAYRKHFCNVPASFPEDELVTVDAYLAMSTQDAARHIPYIWAIDSEKNLRRVAVTQRLALACRDRLGFWATLQELSGARSEHVDTAVAAAREQIELEMAAQRDALVAEQSTELERIRNETAGEAMQQLAASLLDTDLDSLASGAATKAPAAAVSSETAAGPAAQADAPAAIAVEPEEEDEGFDEPFIDTILCTTCNDCININGRLFVYNDNKQAIINDPKAGSFAELVRAAENCPARCIHPGKPLNPDEANLDELIKRAAKFN